MGRSAVLWRVAVAALCAGAGLVAPSPAHADSIRDSQWHLEYLRVAEAHRVSRGEGVTVAVIDTGVDSRHPDLKGGLLKGRALAGDRDDGWSDPDGHGTAMASLIAGRGHGPGRRDGVLGIAPGAKILPVRTATENGDPSAMPSGIEWAVDHGADIISVAVAAHDLAQLRDAVAYALEEGVVVIAAVGNTSLVDEVQWPAAYPGVVAVSGTDESGEFSDVSVSGPEVVLSAPATRIMAAGAAKRGRYASGTGTSGATAIVAGVAALVKSKYPDLDAANIVNRLIATADDRGPEGRDPEYGFGVVDPVKALTADVPRVAHHPLLSAPAGPPVSASPDADAGGLGPVGVAVASVGGVAALGVVIAVGVFVLRRRRWSGPGA
ncbi:MAG: type VII secretion-associated serine protease mycosin [Micromonosporaceae bacterium]